MSTQPMMPDWANELFQKIVAAVEFRSPAQWEAFHTPPEETGEQEHLVEIAPALMEMTGGPEDGEEVFGIVEAFDLVAAHKAFDQLDGMLFVIDDEDGPLFQIEGKSGGQNVVVVVYMTPFDDVDEDLDDADEDSDDEDEDADDEDEDADDDDEQQDDEDETHADNM